jgi:hypothetical protein
VNIINFQNLKICQILSFLWSLEYKVFGIETLLIERTQHCSHLEFFTEFFGKLKMTFSNFEKKSTCSLSYKNPHSHIGMLI